MASEKLGMIPTHQVHKPLSSHPQAQLVFPEALACLAPPHHGSASVSGEQGPKTTSRDLTSGFLDHQPHFFHAPQPKASEFRHQWAANSRESARNASGDGDEEEDYDGDEEEEGNNLQTVVTVAKIGSRNQGGSYSSNDNSREMKRISGLGIKQSDGGQCGNGRNGGNRSAVEARNTRGGEVYYAPYLNGEEGPSSSSGQRDIVDLENGCGFSGRKDNFYLNESGEPLRVILSDPLTGKLMDDAMILPCGHSFGGGGIEQIIRLKACCTCSKPVSEDAIAPNLSLRIAVQAFRREEELLVGRSSKRKRERYDRDVVVTYGHSTLPDHPRGNGIQFPFAITDRVIIKGNKRTPLRFVGREAIVTAQCLNGWYVVKTLDNAESVKLQYRSLAKVSSNPASDPLPPAKMMPNWL